MHTDDLSSDDEDPEGRVFAIQVSDRPYYLRAETRASCKDWVINLNRVREARLEIGGIQLVQRWLCRVFVVLRIAVAANKVLWGGSR